jgi:hypothetical protein
MLKAAVFVLEGGSRLRRPLPLLPVEVPDSKHEVRSGHGNSPALKRQAQPQRGSVKILACLVVKLTAAQKKLPPPPKQKAATTTQTKNRKNPTGDSVREAPTKRRASPKKQTE